MPKLLELLDGVPAVADQGHLGFSTVTLIEGEDRDGRLRRIVVDSGHNGRRLQIVDALDAVGLTPLDIDYLVSTHAHWDHIQNHDLFVDAKHLIHADERRYAHRPAVDDWATPSWTGYVLEQLDTEEVGDDHEIIPGVKVLDLPGHSPGSIGISVETDDGLAVLAGDALHVSGVATSEVNPLVFWDERAATASIRRVKRVADVIHPAHDAAFRILANGELEFQRTIEMAVGGIAPRVLELADVLPVSLMPGRHDHTSRTIAERVDDDRLAAVHALVGGPYAPGERPVPSSGWERG